MLVRIKTQKEIEKMRVAGTMAAELLEMINPYVRVGASTEEINNTCHDYIVNVQGAIPAPLNYHGFTKSICTSINHVVCHGIPASRDSYFGKILRPAILKDGDIINIDVTVIKDGYHGDTSKMFLVGDVAPSDRYLCEIAQESLYLSMKLIKPGARLKDIGTTIEKYIKDQNKNNHRTKLSIVRRYCGHGIGRNFHEEPQVVHYRNDDRTVLKEGMIFTIEPMINSGKFGCRLDDEDGWTAYTADNKNSAQWEHTLLVTPDGCEVLTRRSEETIPRFFHND